MPKVNPHILQWARETAGLEPDQAARKLGIKPERLSALETGAVAPTKPQLKNMAKEYRRPLAVFYLSQPPKRAARGEDFRRSPGEPEAAFDPRLDALLRNIRARHSVLKETLEEEESPRLPFVGSATMQTPSSKLAQEIASELDFNLEAFYAKKEPSQAFAYLRGLIEAQGIFVLLVGNLGSYHTDIEAEVFRGFAIADPVAPFIAINDNDAKTAWSFTALHELVHIWLGKTGISGFWDDNAVEQFCNDVAGEMLLPAEELHKIGAIDATDMDAAVHAITTFANERKLSRSMVAYRLYRQGQLERELWQRMARRFRDEWRNRSKSKGGSPDYHTIRKHKTGKLMLETVGRGLSARTMSYTKAGLVLGVKPLAVDKMVRTGVNEAGR